MTVRTGSSSLALKRMTVRHGNAGLDGVFGTDVAMTDPVVVEVPGDEAARDVAVDRCDVLAVEADIPDPRGRSREGDAYAGRWLLYVALDSVVLDRRTRATEGRERHVEERAPPRSWATRHVRRYTALTQTTMPKTSGSRSDRRQFKAPRIAGLPAPVVHGHSAPDLRPHPESHRAGCLLSQDPSRSSPTEDSVGPWP